MKNITSTIELEEHCGFLQPKDPWKFAKDIEVSQPTSLISNRSHTILFNKGRYFETTIIDKSLRASISQAIKSKIKYNTMITDSWKKLEAFVKAMNKRNIYIHINIDWI